MAIELMEIRGAKELNLKLSRLPDKVSKKIAMTALRSGGKIIMNRAKMLCPVVTGTLQKSIKVRVPRRKKRNVAVILVGIDSVPMGGRMGGKAFYGAFVEFGTPNTTPPRAANPFMRPAFDGTRTEVIEAISNDLAVGIALAAD